MSAWWVFSAAGFYTFCPGTPYNLIGSPLFEETRIGLPEGRSFVGRAKGNSPSNRYIQSAKFNGEPFTKSWLAHDTITAGGILDFEMGPEPNKDWGSKRDNLPPDAFR